VTDQSAEVLLERNRAGFDGLGGGIYSFYIARPALSRVVGRLGTPEDLAAWIERAGLHQERLRTSGPFAYFEASA